MRVGTHERLDRRLLAQHNLLAFYFDSHGSFAGMICEEHICEEMILAALELNRLGVNGKQGQPEAH